MDEFKSDDSTKSLPFNSDNEISIVRKALELLYREEESSQIKTEVQAILLRLDKLFRI